MILDSIKLENIRSYQSQSVEFPRGITLFEGDIGSGKSAILMGIEFALFGLGSAKAEGLLAKKADKGSVTLCFTVEDKKYEIKRSLKRSTSSVGQDPKNCYLKIDKVEHLYSPSELKQKILHVLKFREPESSQATSRIFRYAVFTPQEEMKTVLQRKDIRLETIRKAFQMEDYKIAVENAEKLSSGIKTKMMLFKERFKNIEQTEMQLQEIQDQAVQTESKIKILKNEEKEQIQKEQAKQKEIESIRGNLQEKTKLEERQKNLRNEINEIKEFLEYNKSIISSSEEKLEATESELSRLKKTENPTSKKMVELQKNIADFVEISNKIISIKSEIRTVQSHLEGIKSRIKDYKSKEEVQQRLAKEEEVLKEIQRELEESEKRRNSLRADEMRLKKDIIDIETGIKNVKELGAKCKYCGHALTKEYIENQENERQENLSKTKVKLEENIKNLTDAGSLISELKSKKDSSGRIIDKLRHVGPDLAECDSKNVRLKDLEVILGKLEAENKIPVENTFPNNGEYDSPVSYLTALKDKLQEYEGAQDQIRVLEERHQSADSDKAKALAQISEKEAGISRHEGELAQIQDDLEAYSQIDSEISQKQSEIDEIQNDLQNTRNKISTDEANLANQKSSIDRLAGEKTEAEKWKAKHQKFSNYYDWMRKFFIPTVSHIEKQVLLSIQQAFNKTYKKRYSILIDDPTKESYIDEEFTPIIVQDSYDQNVDYLSGGEKTSIALAYRLTLNSIMRQETDSLKSNLLILDEPTDGFSKTQLSKVRSLFDELHSEQIILVSHERELESYVDHIFHVSKNSGISNITKAS